MAKSKEVKAPEVIKGDDQGRDVVKQTKAARGEEDGGKVVDKVDNRNKEAAELRAEADPNRKATDLLVAARRDHLEANGATDANASGSLKKVELADVKQKVYSGTVTCSSVHSQTHEKISARIELPAPCGEEYVWHVFQAHHANAMREYFEIDPSNEADPNLRSRYE